MIEVLAALAMTQGRLSAENDYRRQKRELMLEAMSPEDRKAFLDAELEAKAARERELFEARRIEAEKSEAHWKRKDEIKALKSSGLTGKQASKARKAYLRELREKECPKS